MAVFLVIGSFIFSFLFLSKVGIAEQNGVFGGSATLIPEAQGAEVAGITAELKVQDSPSLTPTTVGGEFSVPNPNIQSLSSMGTIEDPGQPIGQTAPTTSFSPQKTYIVKKGDTLSRIAISFGVSQDKIAQSNPSVNFSKLKIGTSIIIPGTAATNSPTIAQSQTQNSTLPNFNNSFIIPASGHNWGTLDQNNAVDIANACGTPVVAAADGLVIPDPNNADIVGGWNGGYGNFVLLQHPFGNSVMTRYSHLETVSVQVGDYVKQGQEIGLMGESGGTTECQVNFAVIGAQNPFVKN